MIAFYKVVENGLIIGIGTNGNNSVIEISKAEYNEILSVIRAIPAAPEGYRYVLHEDLTWELIEDPGPDPGDEDATEQDYQDALEQMGVEFNADH